VAEAVHPLEAVGAGDHHLDQAAVCLLQITEVEAAAVHLSLAAAEAVHPSRVEAADGPRSEAHLLVVLEAAEAAHHLMALEAAHLSTALEAVGAARHSAAPAALVAIALAVPAFAAQVAWSSRR
jgi:hypothetical protein